APSPAPDTSVPRVSRPGRTTSSPRHDALPGAWQRLGRAAPRTGAAHPVRVPSGTPCVLDNNSTNHAARGQAGAELPGVHRDVGHGGRSVVPREPQSLWSPSAMILGRSACPLHAGDALMSLVTS